MAIISEQAYVADGSQREFQVTGRILSDSHIAVWLVDYLTTPPTETRLSTGSYDVLGSTVLLDEAPADGLTVSLILTDNGEGIETSPSELTDISANINSIVQINDNIDAIVSVNANEANINSVVTNEANINIVSGSIDNVNIVGDDIDNVNSIAPSIGNVNIVAPSIGNVNTVANSIASVDTNALNIADINTNASEISSIQIVGQDLSNNYAHIEDFGSITDAVGSNAGTSNIKIVSDNIDNVNITGTNMASITTVANQNANITNIATDIVPNITEILLADDNAVIATTKASEASQSALNASTSETNAGTSEVNALASENKAYKWAEENEDVPVEAGMFSAKHWAIKASNIAGAGVINDVTTGVATTYSSSKIEYELSERDNAIQGIMITNTDINTVTTGGRYGVIGLGNTNLPVVGECYMEVLNYGDGRVMQMLYYPEGSQYSRIFDIAWSAWFKHNVSSNIGYDNTVNGTTFTSVKEGLDYALNLDLGGL